MCPDQPTIARAPRHPGRTRRALTATAVLCGVATGLTAAVPATAAATVAPAPAPTPAGARSVDLLPVDDAAATTPPAPSTTDAPHRPADAASCLALTAAVAAEQARLEAELAAVTASAAPASPAGRGPDAAATPSGPAIIDRASALFTRTASAAVPLEVVRADRADLDLRCGLLAVAEATRGVDTRLRLDLGVPADVPATDSWQRPVAGAVTSPYGYRIHPVTGTERLHTGDDIDAGEGDPVRPATAGLVIWAGEANGYGNLVIVAHPAGVATLYAHLSRIDVVVGDRVNRADVLGLVGSTGVSTGSHLHFEVRVDSVAQDPGPWLPAA